VSVVREAMVPTPASLDEGASAQEAGKLLARPEVRAVFVVKGDVLTGVVTRKTLVREVVSPGLDPKTTPLRDIAEEPHWTIDSEQPLDEAFHFLEEHDAERVPVTDGGRLVGVLSRSVLQRRMAEDEPPEDDSEA
jgi:CBS domain-containing protein